MHEPDEAVLDRQRPGWLEDLARAMRYAGPQPEAEKPLSELLLLPNGTPVG